MSVSDVICTCGATPERDSFGNALPCMRCYFGASDVPAKRIAELENGLRRIVDFAVPDGLASWEEVWAHLRVLCDIATSALGEK
jgi:hypothetical protein